MNKSRIASMDIIVVCPCGQGEVHITMASQLYHDALCPSCHQAVVVEIIVKNEDMD